MCHEKVKLKKQKSGLRKHGPSRYFTEFCLWQQYFFYVRWEERVSPCNLNCMYTMTIVLLVNNYWDDTYTRDVSEFSLFFVEKPFLSWSEIYINYCWNQNIEREFDILPVSASARTRYLIILYPCVNSDVLYWALFVLSTCVICVKKKKKNVRALKVHLAKNK